MNRFLLIVAMFCNAVPLVLDGVELFLVHAFGLLLLVVVVVVGGVAVVGGVGVRVVLG